MRLNLRLNLLIGLEPCKTILLSLLRVSQRGLGCTGSRPSMPSVTSWVALCLRVVWQFYESCCYFLMALHVTSDRRFLALLTAEERNTLLHHRCHWHVGVFPHTLYLVHEGYRERGERRISYASLASLASALGLPSHCMQTSYFSYRT